MEFLVLLAGLLIIGSILGLIAFFQLLGLKQEIKDLRKKISSASQAVHSSDENFITVSTKQIPNDAEVQNQLISSEKKDYQAKLHLQNNINHSSESEQLTEIDTQTEHESEINASETTISKDHSTNQFLSPLIKSLTENWMIWLGGACIALAGIFLARYAIQRGVFGPSARIIMGLLTGAGLHFAAEYLRRKTLENNLVFAMLAAGGSITLFATLLAAWHLYEMFNPAVIFIILAVVAIATCWLALIYGPGLAAMGMLGAYLVPVLVSTGSGNVLGAMLYSLVITLSVLLLFQFVYRYWLWIGIMVGSLFWWAVSLTTSNADGWQGLYLMTLAYCLISLVSKDFYLMQKVKLNAAETPLSVFKPQDKSFESLLPLSFLLICIAQLITILVVSSAIPSFIDWLPLAIILLLATHNKEDLTPLPWLLFLGHLLVLITTNISLSKDYFIVPLEPLKQSSLFIYLTIIAILFSSLAYRNYLRSPHKNWWSSLTILAPLLSLVTSYLLGTSYIEEWLWSMNAVFFGAFYIFLATQANTKNWNKAWTIWLFLAGHFAYTFAAVLLFDEAGLTLAIAIQAISIAYIIKRFDVPELSWLLKTVLILVAIRLTINPWLVDYPTTEHWSLWSYGGSTVCCFLTSRLLLSDDLRKWTEATTLHLLVLTLWTELRFWLYDGVVFHDDYSFTEAAINISLFGLLSLVYHYKKMVSESMTKLYNLYSKLLMSLAFFNYIIIIINTIDSHYWVTSNITNTPLLNILLVAYGLPILISCLSYYYFDQAFKKLSLLMTLISGFIFINLEIRHLWTGNINLRANTTDGELYTYSAVWLVIAIAGIIGGGYRYGKTIYKAGMMLLSMVILKVFIIDLSQLDGIYRIVAFMGLGLSLLGIAYLHKKIGSDLKT